MSRAADQRSDERDALRLGVDVGGTSVKLGLVRGGRVVASSAVATAAAEGCVTGLVAAIQTAASALSQAGTTAGPQRFTAAGVGVPGVMSEAGERVLQSPNLPWLNDAALADLLQAALGVPVRCDNDANCIGWGEAMAGAGLGTPDQVCLTLGTGVGGAIVLGGALVRGSRGRGAELGHLCVVPRGAPCGCGGQGCLEQYASQTGLLRMLAEVGLPANGPSAVRALFAAPAGPGEARDPRAARVLADMSAALGRAMANLYRLTGVQVFVLAGGIGAATPVLRRSIVAAAAGAPIDLRQGALGSDAGIVGAALLSLR